jgi:hypothetical protein
VPSIGSSIQTRSRGRCGRFHYLFLTGAGFLTNQSVAREAFRDHVLHLGLMKQISHGHRRAVALGPHLHPFPETLGAHRLKAHQAEGAFDAFFQGGFQILEDFVGCHAMPRK